MEQYFNSFEEKEDDPVLFELDVYLNNPTLADILPDLEKLPNNLSFLKELYNKPFERLLFLQYPLELSNHTNESSSDGRPSKLMNLNTSDRLTLTSLEIGENIQNTELSHKKSYLSRPNEINRHNNSPLVKLNYDIGAPYLAKYKSSPLKKSHKPSFLSRSHSDFKTSPKFRPSSFEFSKGTTLTLDSTVATSEHVIDCLGVLKVENTEEGVKRELHLLPVKAILQLRPKLDTFNEEVIPGEENSTELFYNRNITWKTVDNIFVSDSPEAKELIEMFSRYGKEQKEGEGEEIRFLNDKEMYVNSLCVPVNGTLQSFGSFAGVKAERKRSSVNKVTYTRMLDLTPSLKFMKMLDVKLQLKLLLSQRYTDSFYSLKRDMAHNGLDDETLIEMLKEFAKVIGGNWVLNSEHAIENYTEEDEYTQEEREYLIGCRNLMLSLLNRHTLMPSTLNTNTSVGHLTSEQFVNASGLPLVLVNEILATIARPQGKFWVPKLDKDEYFCQRYPQVVNAFQKYWSENVSKSANAVQSFKINSRVNQIVRNIMIKRSISGLIKDKICTHEAIMEHLESLGYSQHHENVEPILDQVGVCLNKRLWTYKSTNAFLTSLKSLVTTKQRVQQQHQVPNFVLRRIYKYTL
nr:hypothetical protein MACL_00002339 [Theileria orientalis]